MPLPNSPHHVPLENLKTSACYSSATSRQYLRISTCSNASHETDAIRADGRISLRSVKDVYVDDTPVELSLWDTAGSSYSRE